MAERASADPKAASRTILPRVVQLLRGGKNSSGKPGEELGNEIRRTFYLQEILCYHINIAEPYEEI